MHLENREIRKEVQIISYFGKDQLVSESVSKTCVRFAPLFSLVVGQCFRFRPVCQLMRYSMKKKLRFKFYQKKMKSHLSSDGFPHFFLESALCPSRLHALFDFLKNSWHPNKPEHEYAQNIMKATKVVKCHGHGHPWIELHSGHWDTRLLGL